MPSLVDLLTYDDLRVVGAAARALRNLSIDERNKELVGELTCVLRIFGDKVTALPVKKYCFSKLSNNKGIHIFL